MTEKVVLRYKDGSVVKGSLRDFSETAKELSIEEYPSGNVLTVRVDLLKAIFFVRSFEGDPSYREVKRYGISREKGRKVYVRFKDKESLLGYLDGELPWQKGFFLSRTNKDSTGFFLVPVDEGCNNIKIFVVGSAIDDIAVM
ncbi:MAG: hypothetical protein GXO94_05095 [Nitrospirae bacterium]|nr:hypothetical protein [Nitrospirota bacterium]